VKGRWAQAAATIDAPLDLVWSVMLDLDAYPAWNPFVVRVDGPVGGAPAVGDDLRLHVRWTSGRGVTSTERITRLEPPGGEPRRAALEYEFRGPLATLGLVRGRRLQEVEEVVDGTRYRTSECLHGRLAFAAPIGRVRDGFERHAAALQARAEAVHAGTA
jgi:Polyketide cyclase / dehydrase and lipid transport